MPDEDYNTGQIYLRLIDDKLDNVYFPSRGHFGRFEYAVSREGLGSDTDFDQAKLGYFHAYGWGSNVLIGGLDIRTTLGGDAPIQNLYRLGGFQNLSGYEQDELTGQQFGLAKVVYMRRIRDLQFFKAYVGASLEVGNAWEDTGDIGDDLIFAGSAFVGVDTPIGPIYLGYGHAEGNNQSLYLFLGPLFSFR